MFVVLAGSCNWLDSTPVHTLGSYTSESQTNTYHILQPVKHKPLHKWQSAMLSTCPVQGSAAEDMTQICEDPHTPMEQV